MKNEKLSNEKLILGLIVASLLVVLFNSIQIASIETGIDGDDDGSGKENLNTGAKSLNIIPKGIPKIYGKELGINFDDISPNDPQKADATIRVLAEIDRVIELSGNELERYINVLYKLENGISCEYCCGARAIIFEDGKPACGCAHSFAMRGLAKHLITKHGSEYSDAEILEEVGKLKVLFFPTQLTQKAKILKEKGIELSYVNIASNKYRGIETREAAAGGSGGGSGMVGGC